MARPHPSDEDSSRARGPRQRAAQFDPVAAEAALRTHGYLVIEGLLTPDEVAAIKGALSPWLQGRHFGRNDFEGERTERVYALLAKAPILARIVEHPTVLTLLDRLLPAQYLLSAALAINVHPGETPQPFHIDDSSTKLPGPRPHPHLGVSTIWAFDDFTGTNGATEVLPGSHLWDDSRFPVRDADPIKVLMPAGSAVVFLGNLVHRGGANRSDRARLAITPQYCVPWVRQIENMVLAVPPEAARQYSPRIQEMLGYNTIDPGFVGYVDGVHPRRLIDPAYRGRKARGLPS
jgi:ectoine hydroxylase-related dioxygenase (phytanoyl-CoA dioxygenase family)